MLRVAICDDQPVFINILEEAVQSLCMTINLDFKVVAFTSGAAILTAPMDYDILLLDIELDNKQNGLDVGQRLRQRGLTAPIIIVTSHDDFYKQGYKISPHRYIEKPIKQAEFDEAILTAIALLQNSRKVISVRFGFDEVLIPIQQIVIIETNKRNRLLRVWNGTEIYTQETSMSWEQLTEQLPSPQFAFIQKSFLINQGYLRARTATSVTLKHLGEFNISKRYAGEFGKMYQKFIEMGD